MPDDAQDMKALAPLFRQLPDPQELKRALLAALEDAYQAARLAMGTVTMPADTFALHRSLAAARERFTLYRDAFGGGVIKLRQMQEEQLTEAVGEQAGIPNQGLTIPDAEGDIQLSLDVSSAYDFNLDQLITVVATSVVEDPDSGDRQTLVEEGIRTFLGLGKFDPQITKVKAYAAQVARDGDDKLSAVVSSAARKVAGPYKGVKFERKKPK